jgi:hypothetical protein
MQLRRFLVAAAVDAQAVARILEPQVVHQTLSARSQINEKVLVLQGQISQAG